MRWSLCNENDRERNVCIRCSFDFPVRVGVVESIVNAPLVSLQVKNTNHAESDVRFKELHQSCNPWSVHNRLFNANFAGNLNEHPIQCNYIYGWWNEGFFSYGVCTEVSSDFGKFQRHLNRKETLTTYFVSIQPLYNGSPSLFFAFVSFTIEFFCLHRGWNRYNSHYFAFRWI
jgi:hypothetical protein